MFQERTAGDSVNQIIQYVVKDYRAEKEAHESDFGAARIGLDPQLVGVARGADLAQAAEEADLVAADEHVGVEATGVGEGVAAEGDVGADGVVRGASDGLHELPEAG